MRSGSRRAVVVLTVAYVVLAGLAVREDRFLHDEGLLTHLLADLVGRDFLATVFLQKARPPLALLYAPVAGAGLSAFLWVHVLVSAAAVPLVALTSHAVGHRRPELAAAVVALSPMFLAAGAAGLMNADAVTGVALGALAWSRRRWLLAGLVLGALVWVRAELAVLALTFAGITAWRRRGWAWVGLAGFPLVYGLAGALYHGDLLWMLHFPPALSEPMPDNPFWQAHHARASLPTVMAALIAITPAMALVGLWRPRGTAEVEWAGLSFAAVFVAALLLLPQWQVFNFDLSPRYLLPALPMVALAVGRVTQSLGPEPETLGGGHRALGLGSFMVLAVLALRLGGGEAALAIGIVAASSVALDGAGWSRASRLVLGGLLGIGPLVLTEGARIDREQQAPALHEMVARLHEHPDWASQPLYTNEPLLAAFLERGGALPGRDVRYLVQADQLHELTSLSNPANGQRDALLTALTQGFYGTPVMPDALRPEMVPAGAVFVLREDPRLELVMPREVWDDRLRVVHPGRGMTIAIHEGGEP